MSKDDIGRVAFAGIVGIFGAVAITKPALAGQEGMNEGIIRWLLYVVACGLTINTQEENP